MVAGTTVMVNLLGGDLDDLYPAYLHCMARDPELKIHVYGKTVKPGRKIGHVTVVGARAGAMPEDRGRHDSARSDMTPEEAAGPHTEVDDLLDRARHAVGYLRGDIDE